MIGIEAFEKVDCFLEEINDLFLRSVTGVAARVQGADASAVLAPLMRPETLVVPLIVLPICVHVIEKVSLAIRREDVGYVGVGTVWIAVRVVCPVTVVWPTQFMLAGRYVGRELID